VTKPHSSLPPSSGKKRERLKGTHTEKKEGRKGLILFRSLPSPGEGLYSIDEIGVDGGVTKEAGFNPHSSISLGKTFGAGERAAMEKGIPCQAGVLLRKQIHANENKKTDGNKKEVSEKAN